MAITLVGTTASMVKLGRFELPVITGFATRITGTVNVTIANTTAISFTTGRSYVDFGNGSITGTWTSINTTTVGGANPNTFANPSGFRVQNDGNTNVNVTVNGSAPSTFLGGTNPSYAWNATGGEGGCTGNLSFNLTIAKANFSTTPAIACYNLTYPDAGDAFDVEIYLQVPSDAATGTHTDSLVGFQATNCMANNCD